MTNIEFKRIEVILLILECPHEDYKSISDNYYVNWAYISTQFTGKLAIALLLCLVDIGDYTEQA